MSSSPGDASPSDACGCHGSRRLVVVRGNSGSGKSTIGRHLQARHGRGAALIEQDYLRRIVLRERDVAGGAVAGLIDQTVRYALDHGYHVILEGILFSVKYGAMLRGLREAHPGLSTLFYLDVPFDETVRRHATRPEATAFTAQHMAEWYRGRDLLGHADEHVIPASSTLQQSIATIAERSGLTLHDPSAEPPPPGFRPVPSGRE